MWYSRTIMFNIQKFIQPTIYYKLKLENKENLNSSPVIEQSAPNLM